MRKRFSHYLDVFFLLFAGGLGVWGIATDDVQLIATGTFLIVATIVGRLVPERAYVVTLTASRADQDGDTR